MSESSCKYSANVLLHFKTESLTMWTEVGKWSSVNKLVAAQLQLHHLNAQSALEFSAGLWIEVNVLVKVKIFYNII